MPGNYNYPLWNMVAIPYQNLHCTLSTVSIPGENGEWYTGKKDMDFIEMNTY
jgi:hypothetical protein